MEQNVEMPKEAAICAARHFAAAFESAKMREIVDFGEVCDGCECLGICRADWLKTAAPLFEAAGIYPVVFRVTPSEPSCIKGSPVLCRLWRRIHDLKRRHNSRRPS